MSARPILLIGAHGQLGRELARSLAVLGPLHALGRAELDLTDADAIARVVDDVRPGLIVNAAAYTAVDRAESEPELAFAINARAPGLLAEAAARLDGGLVHYSTDYVFSGEGATPWRESDATAPVNVYGASKLAGEQAVLASGADALILRTSWVYGGPGQNFVNTMLRLAGERERLTVVDDQIGAPTASRFLADATLAALAQDWRARAGLYHLSASGDTSWCGFARAIVDQALAHGQALKLSAADIAPIPSSSYPTPARRPANSRLDCSAFEQAFAVHRPHWRAQLAAHFASRG